MGYTYTKEINESEIIMRTNEVNQRRLKTARLYRGMTVDQLAKQTDIVKKDIISFEDSKYEPRKENVIKIAKALKFPEDYFEEADYIKVVVEGSSLRSGAGLNKQDEIASKEKLILVHKICDSVKEFATFPKLNLPGKTSSFSSMEDLTMKLRNQWNVGNGPIESVSKVMESAGIIISDINVEKKGAISFTQKQSIQGKLRYLVALGNDGASASVRNYDLAYELGFIMASSLGIPVKKLSQDEFACSFLLPSDSFKNDLTNPEDLESYIELKEKWNVPISAMIFRAHQLGVLNYKKYNYMMSDMERKGWLNEEPLDHIKDNNVSMLKRMIESVVRKNIDVVGSLSADGITMYSVDIEDVLGLKKGSLSLRRRK